MTSHEYVKYANLFRKYYGDRMIIPSKEVKPCEVKSFDPFILDEMFGAMVGTSFNKKDCLHELEKAHEKLDLLEFMYGYVKQEAEGLSWSKFLDAYLEKLRNEPR